MRGYDPTSYGEGFADVYDEWYSDVTDVAATVDRVVGIVGPGGRVLELGIGTGRIAVPLAEAGLSVVGVDASQAMLDRIEVAPPAADRLRVVEGDMVDQMPDGSFDAVLIAYNTIYNLLTIERQQACFDAVAAHLAPNGVFIVEAAVPDATSPAGRHVGVRSIASDQVVLTLTDHRPGQRQTSGQFIELNGRTGPQDAVRLRPWSVRWTAPFELDEMAGRAGLALERRDADMSGTPFAADDGQHVSVYRPA